MFSIYINRYLLKNFFFMCIHKLHIITVFAITLQNYQYKSINEIIHKINDGVGLFSQAQLYGLLLKTERLEKEVNGYTSKIMILL